LIVMLILNINYYLIYVRNALCEMFLFSTFVLLQLKEN